MVFSNYKKQRVLYLRSKGYKAPAIAKLLHEEGMVAACGSFLPSRSSLPSGTRRSLTVSHTAKLPHKIATCKPTDLVLSQDLSGNEIAIALAPT